MNGSVELSDDENCLSFRTTTTFVSHWQYSMSCLLGFVVRGLVIRVPCAVCQNIPAIRLREIKCSFIILFVSRLPHR